MGEPLFLQRNHCLSSFRVDYMCPVETVRIGYARPMFHKLTSGRNVEMKKCYLLLITSTSTCAVHLEVTTDVKGSSLLFALCRFFARGGIPNMIIRGNFKAFKAQGANIFCEVNNRKWKFIILERSPGWGIL